MPKAVTYGKTERMSFARHEEIQSMPNLLEIQKNSYKWFLEEGLRDVFKDVDVITDYSGNLELRFVDYAMDENPKYTEEECKARDATYAAPLKVSVRLRNKETEEIKEQEIFMGEFPLMTKGGTFVINGAERVIVSQIVRSPGVYYARNADKADNITYAVTVIPYRGAWLEYETDLSDIFNVRIDKNRKLPVTCLIRAVGPQTDSEILELFGEEPLLVSTLESFGVRTRVLDICRGPSVTRYELQPLAGVKISRITGLADDIALNLAAAGVRIEAPIPGKPAVGVEVPNRKSSPVCIRCIFESPVYTKSASPLTLALGKDIAGNAQVADLCKMPHLLIAGSTGSGKSVCVNSIIVSFLYKSSPEDVKLILIDPKVVELAEYNGIPHLLMPVVTEPKKAAGALGSAVQEMERRYRLFAENNVRDIKSFNKLAAERPELEKMPYIAIIIDELADLMMVVGKDVEDSICRIAQKARAAGMHLIVATQRPSVDVITGLIKANIPSRIAFAVSSQVDSRTILDGSGAEKLLGMGDMLFMPVGAPKPTRIQGTFVRDEEISRVLDFIKQSGTVQYDEAMIEAMEKHAIQDGKKGSSGADADEEPDSDPMFKQAVEVVIDAGQASTSLLQRRCKLGYARAARIMDEMEQKGVIGPYEGAKPRAVLISRQQWLEMQMNQPEE